LVTSRTWIAGMGVPLVALLRPRQIDSGRCNYQY
jgi:hypothetical protein